MNLTSIAPADLANLCGERPRAGPPARAAAPIDGPARRPTPLKPPIESIPPPERPIRPSADSVDPLTKVLGPATIVISYSSTGRVLWACA